MGDPAPAGVDTKQQTRAQGWATQCALGSTPNRHTKQTHQKKHQPARFAAAGLLGAMSTIIELRAKNFKRLRAITIRPDGSTVVIGGRNAQGKSSTLDAIMAALGGGRSLPADPIRHGEKKAEIRVELGDLIVTRKFSTSGSKLEVIGKDGAKLTSPQKVLDQLTGSLSFDPLAFTRQSASEQAETLRQLAGLDLSEVDSKIARIFDERKGLNADAKRLRGAADSLPMHKGSPAEPVVISELVAEISKRRAHNDARKACAAQRDKVAAQSEVLQGRVDDAVKLLETLEREQGELVNEEGRLQRQFELGHWQDCDEVQAQIEGAEETNAKIRDNAAAFAGRKAAENAEGMAEDVTVMLEDAREERANRIAAATFPVDGLAVDEDGVTFKGVAFEQASGAEKIRVSAAIGLAMNPELRILLIRDGSLLDADAMAMLQQLASENDAQIWIERVGDGDACGIVIEDGEIID